MPLTNSTKRILNNLKYPCIAMPKIQGVSCSMNHTSSTKSANPTLTITHPKLPPLSPAILTRYAHPSLTGFTGVLAVGSPSDDLTFKRTTSLLKSTNPDPWALHQLIFYPMDYLPPNLSTHTDPFSTRLSLVNSKITALHSQFPKLAYGLQPYPYHSEVTTPTQAEEFLYAAYFGGFEGAIFTPSNQTNSTPTSLILNRPNTGVVLETYNGNPEHRIYGMVDVISTLLIKLDTGKTLIIKAGTLLSPTRQFYAANPSHIIGKRVEFSRFDYGSMYKPQIPSLVRVITN